MHDHRRRPAGTPFVAPRAVSRLVAALAMLIGLGWSGAPTASAMGGSPAAGHDANADEAARTRRYLAELLDEINARRVQSGLSRLDFLTNAANEALNHYLADLTPVMLASGRCFHGDGQTVRPGWEYVAEVGPAEHADGEVLGCPDSNGFWTPARIAESWWRSPPHHAILANPDVHHVACATYGPQRDGTAYQTITCVTTRQ
jgi:hypothetical protein